MSYEKLVMVCLLVVKGLLNKAYCDSFKYICKTIENVNNIADTACRKQFKHKLTHACTYILVDICEE